MDVDESSHCTTTETISRIHTELVNRLKQPVTAEDMFLEMFEEEYYHLTVWFKNRVELHHPFQRNEIKMEHVSTEPGLYLPPSNTPLSGLPLTHRLPCGNEERTRRVSLISLVFNELFWGCTVVVLASTVFASSFGDSCMTCEANKKLTYHCRPRS